MTAASLGPRRAALLLHAMRERDRNWILGQLPNAESVQLRAMLDELRELGIPAEERLLDNALKANDNAAAEERADGAAVFMSAPPDTDAGLQAMIHRIHLLPAPAVAQVLRQEPAALIARFLKITDWPWQDEVLSRVGGVKRRQVEEHLPDAPAGAWKLAESLLGLLLPRIIETSARQAPAERSLPATRSTSWRRRIDQHMQSLFDRWAKAPGTTSSFLSEREQR